MFDIIYQNKHFLLIAILFPPPPHFVVPSHIWLHPLEVNILSSMYLDPLMIQ